MKETKLYSAFPGTGKSYYYLKSNKNVLDSDSSKFDKKSISKKLRKTQNKIHQLELRKKKIEKILSNG